MLPSMGGLVLGCYGPTRNLQAIHMFHGGTLTVHRSQRNPTWTHSSSLLCVRMKCRDRRIFLRITAHSRSLCASISRVRGGRVSKRSSDTITMGGSLRRMPSTVRVYTKNTNQIIYGFLYVLGACLSGVSTRTVASSGVRNIFFLHQ